MRIVVTALLAFSSIHYGCFGQETAKLARKVAAQMCKCIGNVERYGDLKPKLDKCYDQEMNTVDGQATPEEIKIIGNIDDFNEVKRMISKLIKTDCESVRNLVEGEAQASTTSNPYPTNFDAKVLKKAKKNLAEWNGKIVAFDGEILEVKHLSPGKPYMKVKLDGGPVVWVGSMVNSQYDSVNNSIRFLGYFSVTGQGDTSQEYHNSGFHVLAFGEIDHKSKQLAFTPGSERQIQEWGKGQVPTGK
jgi:hypothetical protein